MSKTKQTFLAGVVYLLITLLFFWPCLSGLSTALIGPPEDNMQFLWFIWYGSETLLKQPSQFMHSSLIYYPEGVGLWFANYFYYGVFLSVFLKFFMNIVLIFNFLILHSFILAGIGMFLLLKELTDDFTASLAGGFIFAFNPSHMAHAAHHVTIASIQFVPFFVLFFLRSLRRDRKRDYVLASVFLALNALCDWNYLVFGFLFLGLAYGYFAVKRKKLFLKKEAVKVLAIIGLTFLILSPLILPMITTGWAADFKRKLPGQNIYVADLLGFLIPSYTHWLSRTAWVNALNSLMTGTDWEKTVYLGWANIVLIVCSVKFLWKDHKKYFLALLAFAVLAMGSELHVLGRALPFPLPYRLFEDLPLLSQARNPSRIIVYVYLFLAVLAAFSLKRIITSIKSAGNKKILIWGILFFIFADYFSVCGAMTPVKLPACYKIMNEDPKKDFAVMDVPWDGARYMMYQTLHKVPEVQGYIGRRTNDTLGDRLSFDLKSLDQQKKTLIENKVKYIVIHKKRLTWNADKAEDQSYYKIMRHVSGIYSKFYEKIYEDENAATFRVYP